MPSAAASCWHDGVQPTPMRHCRFGLIGRDDRPSAVRCRSPRRLRCRGDRGRVHVYRAGARHDGHRPVHRSGRNALRCSRPTRWWPHARGRDDRPRQRPGVRAGWAFPRPSYVGRPFWRAAASRGRSRGGARVARGCRSRRPTVRPCALPPHAPRRVRALGRGPRGGSTRSRACCLRWSPATSRTARTASSTA